MARSTTLAMSLFVMVAACQRSSERKVTSSLPQPVALSGSCRSAAVFTAHILPTLNAVDQHALANWCPPAPPDASGRAAAGRVARLYIDQCAGQAIVPLTQALVRFPTVSDPNARNPEVFRDMAAFLQTWAAAANLSFESFGDDDAWEVVAGSGTRLLTWVTHADVVQPGSGWQMADPFTATIKDDRLYGRGVEDDKAPSAAVLLTMRALVEFGLLSDNACILALGTGEENDWSGMYRYLRHAKQAQNTLSLDALYPVVTAESGFVLWRLTAATGRSPTAGPIVVTAEAGVAATQVPGTAMMELRGAGGQSVESFTQEVQRAIVAVDANRLRLDSVPGAPTVRVRAIGQAVHSAFAEQGYNALWPLGRLADALAVEQTGGGALLRAIGRYLADDLSGARLGLAYADPLMGNLIVSPTLLHCTDTACELSINMRRPRGLDKNAFAQRLNAALQRLKSEISVSIAPAAAPTIGEPWVGAPKSELTTMLLDVYQAATGNRGMPQSIHGGTYARLYPGAVSFGPLLPGRPLTAHAPNEYMELDDMRLMLKMTADATLRLFRY